MRATIFNIHAILSLFSVVIHVVPTFVRYAPCTLLEPTSSPSSLPEYPIHWNGIGPVCNLRLTITLCLPKCETMRPSFLLVPSRLRPSRKQLFSGITLNSDQICHGIHQFLVQNPVILSFIRTITLAEDILIKLG